MASFVIVSCNVSIFFSPLTSKQFQKFDLWHVFWHCISLWNGYSQISFTLSNWQDWKFSRLIMFLPDKIYSNEGYQFFFRFSSFNPVNPKKRNCLIYCWPHYLNVINKKYLLYLRKVCCFECLLNSRLTIIFHYIFG